MKLLTFENAARHSRIGAVVEDHRVVDLHIACALYLCEVENEAIFYRLADALVPSDMRALFRGGDTSLEAARKALDYVARRSTGGADVTGPRGERALYSLGEIKLKAPIIPKKFFHTAGNFREHHEEATKAGFSHPVMPWIVFFQNDRQFQLVIQFLGKVFGIDHRLVVSDDRVSVLKKNNPGHDRMRKAGFRRLFVVLAKVARGVKKLFRDDGSLELYVAQRVEQPLSARTGDVGAACAPASNVVESLACGLKARVTAAEQRPHVGRDQGVGQAVENRF